MTIGSAVSYLGKGYADGKTQRTVRRPLVAAGNDPVDLGARRELLSECADGRVRDERGVERVDGEFGGRARVRRDAVERRLDPEDAVRRDDAGAMLAVLSATRVQHQARIHALVGVTLEHDGFASAALFGGSAEENHSPGQRELFEGARGRDRTRAARDRDQVVSARVSEALEGVHLAVEPDRRDLLCVFGRARSEDGGPSRLEVVRVARHLEAVLLVHKVGQNLVRMVLFPANFGAVVCFGAQRGLSASEVPYI